MGPNLKAVGSVRFTGRKAQTQVADPWLKHENSDLPQPWVLSPKPITLEVWEKRSYDCYVVCYYQLPSLYSVSCSWRMAAMNSQIMGLVIVVVMFINIARIAPLIPKP